jgi:hypothetical protein
VTSDDSKPPNIVKTLIGPSPTPNLRRVDVPPARSGGTILGFPSPRELTAARAKRAADEDLASLDDRWSIADAAPAQPSAAQPQPPAAQPEPREARAAVSEPRAPAAPPARAEPLARRAGGRRSSRALLFLFALLAGAAVAAYVERASIGTHLGPLLGE